MARTPDDPAPGKSIGEKSPKAANAVAGNLKSSISGTVKIAAFAHRSIGIGFACVVLQIAAVGVSGGLAFSVSALRIDRVSGECR